MKPSKPFLSSLIENGLTRSQLQRRQHALEDVKPIINDRGHQIFIYNNIRTNQVIYSFTRTLNNNDALKQLPYLGKQTVPRALRKDIWLPFALVEFPSPLQGLNAFRKLREFRRLHETAYPLELITVKEGTEKKGEHAGKLMRRKQRGKVLMDQKANSVADLAAVLLQDVEGPSEKLAKHKERSKRFWDRVDRQKIQAGKPPTNKQPNLSLGPVVNQVKIRWADIMDLHYAERWPENVWHDKLQRSRYTAAFPAYEMVEQEEGDEFQYDAEPPTEEEMQSSGAV